jgi:DNA polymerase-3 subunit epsilon
MSEFVAIDFETANPDLASICQVGIARYVDGSVVKEWESLIDPEDEFFPLNIMIHGITEETVRGAPTLPSIIAEMGKELAETVVVCHTHFDRVSLKQALDKYRLPDPALRWLDSAAVARRTWPQFAYSGYGLSSICEYLGYDYACHNALEDAKAAAHVLLKANEQTGLDVEAWVKRTRQPIDLAHSSEQPYIRRDGNPEGRLFGETIVFTGALSMPRAQAADIAAATGCKVEAGVNKRTTLLVVGDQDIRRVGADNKSNKQEKAERLMLQGQTIRILRETDFKALAQY